MCGCVNVERRDALVCESIFVGMYEYRCWSV